MAGKKKFIFSLLFYWRYFLGFFDLFFVDDVFFRTRRGAFLQNLVW